MTMARQRIVIAGGGWGGIKAAHDLVARLGREHEVVLVDPNPVFRLGFRKTWMLVGRTAPHEATRSKTALAGRGVRYVQERITAIDIPGRTVTTEAQSLEWDYLIVALGAEPRPDLVPGFARTPGAFNLYDPQSVLAARDRLSALSGGRILVAILGLPYKCPPAPYEAALLLDEHLRQRGAAARQAFQLAVLSPQPASVPVAGEAGCRIIESSLALRQIAFHPNRPVARVEPGRVIDANGGEEPFDLLLGVPPHRIPAVAVEAGLAEPNGWIAVDPATLRTRFERVYAVGDCTQILMANGQPLPKAGVFAEGEAAVAAAAIAAEIAGGPRPPAFTGEGYCFLELGGGLATLVRGEFLARPAPRVEVESPSRRFLEQKLAFERERLDGWFGVAAGAIETS